MRKIRKIFIAMVLILLWTALLQTVVGAAGYTPRLSLPGDARSTISQYIINTSSGNPYDAFKIGNCTWYAFGRAWEILGYRPTKLIFDGDAEVWFNQNKSNFDSGNGGFPYSTDRNAPALGAIAVWENTSDAYGYGGHVAVVEQITDNSDGTKTIITSESAYASYYFKTITRSTASEGLGWSGKWKFLGYIYLGDFSTPNQYEPEGNVDHVVSQQITQVLNIKGWAFDRDDLSSSLNIIVCIGGEANSTSAETHIIKADQLREDILQPYPGVGSNHGFQCNIMTEKTGPQTVYIYASNTEKNSPDKLIGVNEVTIKSSTLNYNPGQTIQEGIYNIVSAVNQDYEITVEQNSDDNGRNLHIWRCNNDNNYSKWQMIYIGDGYYKIKNIGSQKCFDVEGGSSALSANVMQYEDHGGDNQLWRIFPLDNGYALQPKCAPGACLDLDQNMAQDNQNVGISNEHLNINQIWAFVPTETVPIGTVDHIVSTDEAQTINVRGWAFDRADTAAALNIIVYIGGEAGSAEAERHIIKADQLREDILPYHMGIGSYHGFQTNIVTSKSGAQTVFIYAANANKENVRALIGSATIDIKEKEEFTISYHLNGGTNSESNPTEYAVGSPLTLLDPDKDHYSFVGWYFSETGDDKFENGSSYEHDLELYARWEKAEELKLPAALTEIDEEAFMGNTSVQYVDLTGSSIEKIGDRSFKGCMNLEKIYIPDSVVSFGTDVFDECENVVIICNADSAAAAYARTAGIATREPAN